MTTRVLHEHFIVTDSLKARFFAKTAKADTGCVIWTGCVQRNGYGAVKIDHQKIDAHVASWRIANGGQPVPVGKLVMHSCDCRCCVNPDHLSIGTVSENMLHAHSDGRGEDFKLKGEQCGSAKLTEDQVRQIRAMYVPLKFGYRKIARALKLNEPCVAAVCYGHSWKHVTSEATP